MAVAASMVLDASVTIAALVVETNTPKARALLSDPPDAIHVPSIWLLEVNNFLVRAIQRGTIDLSFQSRSNAYLAALPLTVHAGVDFASLPPVSELAIKHRLTVYDASYLALALRLGIPIATFDEALAHAAAAENLPVL